ncbi:J domain-containing protein [Candidatus Pelagibacter sp.]|nr:J domain-containing protein [Candidatus Pelagibacter sp.]
MNIIIYALIILVVSYILLRLIASASAKKISKTVRIIIFIISILLALLFAFGGRLLLSLPLILLSLGIIKLKGLTLYQLIGLFRLIQTLRNSGRFSFNKKNSNISTLSVEEAYKILNLDRNNKITKEDVQKAHLKIQKKIHPDVSPETSRLSAIVNEAREVVLKDLT